MPNELYVNPNSGRFNSNRRFNLRWNGTVENFTTAGRCIEGSIADLHGWDWIVETHGFKLRDGTPGPRIFIARVNVPIGRAYVRAVQPMPEKFPAIRIGSHVKLVDALTSYKWYRKDMKDKYLTSPGRPT